MHLPSGTLLHNGKYKIIRFIKSGGFGCTYEGEQTLMGARVAIKEFFVRDFCNREENNTVSVGTQSKVEDFLKFKQRFIKEASVLFRMKNPHIVRVTDVFEDKGTAYYVMDYIEGYSLADIVARKGALDEEEALGYIRQVCRAVKYVHSQNRMHMDIKPGNIMVDKNGKAILIDFGTSKYYDSETGEQTSTLVGIYTNGYAPPEQRNGSVKSFNPATDIYAIGATLYKLLTGITPPDSLSLLLRSEVLLSLPPSISLSTRNAVQVAMQLYSEQRPQSIDEFEQMLTQKADIEDKEEKTSISQSEGSEHGNEVNESNGLISDLGSETFNSDLKGNYLHEVKKDQDVLANPPGESQENLSTEKIDSQATNTVQQNPRVLKNAKLDKLNQANPNRDKQNPETSGLDKLNQGSLNQDKIDQEASYHDKLNPEISNQEILNREPSKHKKLRQETFYQNKLNKESSTIDKLNQVTTNQETTNQKGVRPNISNKEPIVQKDKPQSFKTKIYIGVASLLVIFVIGWFVANGLKEDVKIEEGEIEGHGWVDLGLPSGLKWATCNLGASSAEEIGDYFAWGEIQPKSSYDEENSETFKREADWLLAHHYIDKKGNLDRLHDAANQNWGGNWRMPTKDEMEELINNTTNTWTKKNGQFGLLIQSLNNDKSIFLPATGYLDGANREPLNSDGGYWCSQPDVNDSWSALYLWFTSYYFETGTNLRSLGRTIRPVSD